MIRLFLIGLLTLFLTNCAQKTYEVKQEATKDGRILNEVPQWFVDAEIEKGLITNRDAENYIYGVGSGSSPDLQLAIDKAIMIAKASLADQLQGEMNKRAELFITGYEEWEKAVYETPTGEYRVYIGLKMGVGDANRLAEYIVANTTIDVDVDALADAAIEEVIVE